jgi:hypothetical protein
MQTNEENLAPAETKIYYSTKKTIRGMRVAMVFMAVGVLLPIVFSGAGWAWYFGVLIIIGSTLIGRSIYKYYSNKQPQIIVNTKGIQTTTVPFIAWKDIKGEDVVEINEGKTKGYYLIYDYPYGHAKHVLSFLDTDQQTLSGILKMYRDQSR